MATFVRWAIVLVAGFIVGVFATLLLMGTPSKEGQEKKNPVTMKFLYEGFAGPGLVITGEATATANIVPKNAEPGREVHITVRSAAGDHNIVVPSKQNVWIRGFILHPTFLDEKYEHFKDEWGNEWILLDGIWKKGQGNALQDCLIECLPDGTITLIVWGQRGERITRWKRKI